MSHPPETSRELAEHIAALADSNGGLDHPQLVLATSFIDAWVRVREAEARRNEASIWNSIRITAINLPGQAQIEARNRIIELESVTVTARKQLEDTP